ncbi:MAG: thioredoxin family protein [Thermotogaceae bacterium]|nr:thioredoxin family protein [Thermotogaceae bacterium]
MGLLSPQDVEYLKDLFSKEMEKEVKILLFKSDDKSKCQYCDILLDIFNEVSEIDGRIKVEIFDAGEEKAAMEKYGINENRIPAIAFLTGDGEDKGVRYYGLPAGHEFSTVVQNIVSFSKGAKPDLSPASIEKLKQIDKPVEILVFVTPTCPYCPRAVLMAHEIAKTNENIQAAMVEAEEFPEWSMEHGVSAVPHIVINNETAFVGAYPEDMYVDYVLQHANSDGSKDKTQGGNIILP